MITLSVPRIRGITIAETKRVAASDLIFSSVPSDREVLKAKVVKGISDFATTNTTGRMRSSWSRSRMLFRTCLR